MAADVFSCDYDAPMYVDFNSINQPFEDDEADAWFEAAAAKEATGNGILMDGDDDVLLDGEEEDLNVSEGPADAVASMDIPQGFLHEEQDEVQADGSSGKMHGMVLRKTGSSSSSSQAPTSGRKTAQSGSKKAKLTVPETPDFVRRGRQKLVLAGHAAAKTSEQLEMERIKKLREERRRAVQQSQESFRQLHSSASSVCASVPKRTAVAPTIPVEFKFRTDKRLGKTPLTRPGDGSHGEGSEQFVRQLRSYNAAKPANKGPMKATNRPPTPTQPKPFKFHQTRSQAAAGCIRDKENVAKSTGGAAAKYVSAAEHLRKFQNATPDRFRTLPRSEVNKGPIQPKQPLKATAPRMTVPVTPKLAAKTRARPVAVESHTDKEEKEIEDMKSYQFKATKFDQRLVTENGGFGLPKRTTVKTTVAVDLNLQTSKRCDERAAKAAPPSPMKSFRAQPIPNKILDQPVGVPERPPATVTDARTPNIRKSKRKADGIVEAQAKRLALEGEGPYTMSPAKNTVMEPFDLHTDRRGEQKVEQWRQQVAAEEESSRRAKEFHARSAHVVHEAPFVPAPSSRGPIVPDDVVLNSDIRAEKRQEFDEMRNEKELEIAEEQQRRKLEDEERQKEEVERIRAAMVHKAQPVRHYRPVEVKPSDRALTKPTSPSFSQRITAKYQRTQPQH